MQTTKPFKLIEAENYDQASQFAAEIVIKLVKENPSAILGLATGSTPIGLYQILIKDHQQNKTSYAQIKTFNLDEYVGLDENNDQSYHYFMRDQLFNHIDIDLQNTHVPDGMSSPIEKECKEYEEKLKQAGGIDLQILGIGANGHIAFNEPGTSFSERTHECKLTEQTIKDNSRNFAKIEDVPTKAITMGIGTIMEARKIILIATGKAKAECMKKLLDGEITENLPASILNQHQDVTIIADQDALSLIK